ncbi:uncharacterized protein LOC101848372 [Aplysia californica]|uniref:Uncharacterized protein LOC101848372 n=1 Tax=Aplysia californica TaxID=6500 RepID=A0ABM0JXY5_APLCA|nr:uncharacterized protein LOC101848372 [Aplysia californica]
MSQVTDQLIDVISKPRARRTDAEIETAISWLRRRAQILNNVGKKELVEIVKNCSYETATRDDVIIQQGDYGDTMYIILRGVCLVYIDASLTGEEDPFQASSPPPQLPKDPAAAAGGAANGSPEPRKARSIDRSKYGKFIMRYESGKSFGEAALLCDDKSRNATVLADEDCDLLVLDQALFDKALRAEQELEYAEVCHFVENHPYFRHMSPKFKRLLELSLRKDTFPFDSVMTQQGMPVTSLIFILKGQANMYLEPHAYQKQYSHLWPFEAGVDLYSHEFEWLRESRRNNILRKYEDPAVWPTKSEHLVVKRTEGYAAAEKRVQDRTLCLCSIRGGEVIGDLEVVTKLSTYMFTVTSTSPTTAFVLDLKNLERLVGRRNQVTMEVMKETATEKLEMRAHSHYGKDVSFLSYLLYKIREERLPSAKKLPPIKSTKQLPPKEIQIQHLLEKFKSGEAQLVEPYVHGSLIYKEQMQEKARIRNNIRKRSPHSISGLLREARRKMNRRQPRSRREIVDSLKEMMESDLVEYSTDLPKDKPKATKKKPENPPAPSLTPARKMSNPSPREGAMSTERKGSLTKDPPKTVRFSNDTDKSSPRNINQMLTAPSNDSRGKPVSKPDSRRTSLLPAITETRETSALNGKVDGTRNGEKGMNSSFKSPRASDGDTSRLVSEAEEGPSSATSSKREYQRKEVSADSRSPTRLPPLAKPELKKPSPSSKWDMALRFVNERVNTELTKQLLSSNSGFDDYETSDVSLALLEKRIKSFFTEKVMSQTSTTMTTPRTSNTRRQSKDGDNQDLHLPPLRRFHVDLQDADVNIPKPGGKVWIRKRLCRFANSSIKVKDHEHVRYHMVPELPQFEDVKKARVVMHRILTASLSPEGMTKTTRNSISDVNTFR